VLAIGFSILLSVARIFVFNQAEAFAQSYRETPVILSASEVLPAGVIKGSNYTVAEKVVEHADDVLFND
jgi:hypothetical protein